MIIIFNMNSDYNTKPRRLILDCLKKHSGCHMTAEEISEKLSLSGEKPGLATIYRTLDILSQSGGIKKFVIENEKKAFYEYSSPEEEKTPVIHLKCCDCGKILHMKCSHLTGLSPHIKEEHGFSVDNSKTVLYGKCRECETKGEAKVKDL